MENSLAKALESGEFVVTCEIIPGRGATEEMQVNMMKEAEEVWATGRCHAISITDQPGGNPALAADTFGRDLLEKGIVPLVHFTCKDRNRNQIAAQLYGMERTGIENVLTMSGDYPVSGWKDRPRPVFDLGSVQIVQMLADLNAGEKYMDRSGEKQLKPTHFNIGAVTSPFKWTEAEQMTQYYKLEKKIKAGAHFIISQLGYDARKMEELVWYVRDRGYDIPLIANVYILNAGVGRTMNANRIPGCDVTDEFVADLTEEGKAEDKGLRARLLRGAKMIAIARGLGYQGVHVGGLNVNGENFVWMLDKAEELQADWKKHASELLYGRPGAWYYYKKDPETGLNLHEEAPRDDHRQDGAVMGNYGLSRFVHHLMFVKGKGIFPVFESIIKSRERAKGRHRSHAIEHIGKTVMYGCMDCGDCGLMGCAYICPMTQCPKSQRNGPCGGSYMGWCEVYPDERLCIYYRAYHRLKKFGDEQQLNDYITPPNNWDFFETSAWANYLYGRDNTAKRLRVTPVREGEHPDPKIEPHQD